MTRRVVIVGAGITGLSAAHRLFHDAPDVEVTVLEASPRPGGKLITNTFSGLPVDEGADSFLVRVPWGTQLCNELGLADELVAPAARHASLWLDQALRPIPSPNVLGVPLYPEAVAPGILPDDDLARLSGPGLPNQPLPEGDLSIGAVVRACVGDAVFERLVAPLLGGINAGEADAMSCTAMAPQLLAAGRHPEGMLTSFRQQLAQAKPGAAVFNAHPAGMQRVVSALVGQLGDRLRLSTTVTALTAGDKGWTLYTPGEDFWADGVILTVPSFAAAPLVAPLHLPSAQTLAGIEHASATLVTFAYHRRDLQVAADQSGFLVPQSAGLLMTACSYSGSKWAHLHHPEKEILRVSAGRINDQRHLALDDEALIDALRQDLATTLGVQAPPCETRISPWPDSLPQFPVGHADQMTQLAGDLVESAPGLVVTGAAHHGVGVPACINSGFQAAKKFIS
ncbi:MAG: protoporphyrinogen oxidase [Acidimicrobiales bacterium]|nr:protoporphyrinogen oxidase [Acidimicrobiales bacterium]